MGFSVPMCSRFSERICGRNLRRTHNLKSQIKSVLFKNHGVGVKFRFERSRREINFDRARSTTVKSLLGPLRFAIKRRRGRPLCERAACTLGMESLIRSGGVGKRKAGKKTQGLLWMVNSLPKHKVPISVYKAR